MASDVRLLASGNLVKHWPLPPNLVHSHILGQTQGWSLKIETQKILACPTVPPLEGKSIIYNICKVVCLRLDHEQCHEEMSFCWSWLGPSSGSGTWKGFVSAVVSPLPGCRCCCCRNHPRPWHLGFAGQVGIGLAHDKGWGLQYLRGWSPNKQIENKSMENRP